VPATVLTNRIELPVSILPQPDETTCGPTCLHAIYRYWGDEEPLANLIERTGKLAQGGTFAVLLACDALRRGYDATIYTYNLNVFDPSWFHQPGINIAERLRMQREIKADYRLRHATEGYLEFLRLGGQLRMKDLTRGLVQGLLRRGFPLLTGLSSTYLYRAMREYGVDDTPDDIRGLPSGHFVVLAGYERDRRKVLVEDPYQPNPFAGAHQYWLGMDRVLGAVLLGIVTHDANLLVVRPKDGRRRDLR
jgi:hypothetical protein